jgi:hypothetical protein
MVKAGSVALPLLTSAPYLTNNKSEFRCVFLRVVHMSFSLVGGLVVSRLSWLTRRNVDASKKKFFVATEIIVFYFELFIGERYE